MGIAVTRSGALALIIGHIAGMIDLAALPLWVNTLIAGYGYRPALAGLLPTSFLIGVVIASLALSRYANIAVGRWLAPISFWAAALALFTVPLADAFPVHLILHFGGGVVVGAGLSCIHRTMGSTDNPHRMFSYAGLGFGVFSLLFLGGVPQLIAAYGPQAFFYVVGLTMFCAALVTTLSMPAIDNKEPETAVARESSLPRSVPLAIGGIIGMALVQAMVFSFLVQVGSARGFSANKVESVLIALGIVNLFPPMLAAVFGRPLSPILVARTGALVHGALALTIMLSSSYGPYAFAAASFAGVMIFTHTFIFGFLAKQDPSGRAVAATPAMLMTGSAIAPFLGGTLVEVAGFAAIGFVSAAIAVVSCILFMLIDRKAPTVGAVKPGLQAGTQH